MTVIVIWYSRDNKLNCVICQLFQWNWNCGWMELFQKANSQVEVATLPRPPDLSFFLGFRDLWDPIFPLPTPILFFQVISPQISNLETFWTLDCGFGIPDCWLD